MRIFLSHSGRDKALVREIRDHFPPWLDAWIDEERLLIGTDLLPALKDAIDSEVDYVVVILGEKAADSSWVKQEVQWALQQEQELGRTFLLPIVLDNTRERLPELGLSERLTLEMADYTESGTRFLAERLVTHLGGWMSEQLSIAAITRANSGARDPLRRVAEQVLAIIDDIPAGWRAEVNVALLRPFLNDLAASRGGVIPLTPTQYYKRILSEMSRAKRGTRVLAASTLSSDLWRYDADQAHYATLNVQAVDHGAVIERLFILPEAWHPDFTDVIRRQEHAGVSIKVASTTLLAHVPGLEDFVLFETAEGTRAYVAQASIDGSRRVRTGHLVVSDHEQRKMRDSFLDGWELAATPSAFFEGRSAGGTQQDARGAPGAELRTYRLDSPVVTCEQAAAARKIPLMRELKTLLLETNNGLVAAHLPGDGVLSLRKVKRRLDTTEAYLADPEALLALGLSAGTVSAVLEPVWSMPHLVSRRLLSITSVMTNNGTRTGYFEFSPAVLTTAADVVVDDFEK